MEKDQDDDIEIPVSHFVVRENRDLMDNLAKAFVTKKWNLKDLREWFEFEGYDSKTTARFMKGVMLRVNGKNFPTRKRKPEPEEDIGELPTDEKGNHKV
jgi:hypothetical protein